MSSKSDFDPSLWKIMFWLVLAMLIGVLLLYSHHSNVQKAAIGEIGNRLSETRAKLADAGSALDETSAEAQDAAKQIDQLKQAHADAVEDLKATHAQATQKLEQTHADKVESLQADHLAALDQLKQALQQEQKKRDAQADQLSELEQAKTELEQAKTELEQTLEQTREEDSALRDQLVELTEEKHELQAKLEADNKTIAGLNFELNTANQLEAALRDKLKRGGERQERLQTLVDKEEAAILDLQDKLVALTREREQLLALTQTDGADSGEPTTWQAELERSQALIQELQAELDSAVEERKAAQQKLAQGPSADQVAVAEQAAALEAENAALQDEVDAAEARAAGMESDIEALRAELDAAKAVAEGQLADTSTELERLKPELDALTKARDEAEAAATAARQALEEQKTALAETRQAMEAERKSLQEQLDAAVEAKRDAESRAMETGEANARLTELNETIAQLRQELADAKAGTEAAQKTQGMYAAAAPLGGQLTENGILLSLAGDALRFASGTATLPDGDLPSLDRIADYLKDQSQLSIRIEGHTDSSGGAEINRTLSQQRAEAVMQALAERGVDAERMSAQGIGEERPIASNATDQGRRANRRVEVYAIQPQ
jgi:chemotaxis protein MotB